MTQISEQEHSRQTSLGFLIQLLARRIDKDMKERLDKIDVDIKLFSNIMLLMEKDGVTQRELGRLLEFPDYFTSRTVDILVERGFAERRPDPMSRRTVLVYLTPEGKKKARDLPEIVLAVNNEYLKGLSNSEQTQLIKLLHKVTGIEHSQEFGQTLE